MVRQFYSHVGSETSISALIISVAIMLFGAFLATRITSRLKLPNVTAYILTGILIGPFCLDAIPPHVTSGLIFLPDIALAFIAFSTAEFFKLPTLRENGRKIIIITLYESLAASLLIFILTYNILGLGLPFSIILAALASATAPASIMMIIRQTGAKGDFVETLLSVVALDDVVSLIAFSIAISVAIAVTGGALSAATVLMPIILNVFMVGIGCLFGLLLKYLMAQRSTDNRLIVLVALLFALCGLGAAINVSPLLACMATGTVYINLTNDERLFKQLNYFAPPILLLFFVKSGMDFRLDKLAGMGSAINGTPLAVIGVLYFFVRIAGKYLGAYIGCRQTQKPKLVRNYLGMALIPQAGVSIGLAALGARQLGGEAGSVLQTIILASSVLYELIGPGCAKAAMYLSKAYGEQASSETTDSATTQDEVVVVLPPDKQRVLSSLRRRLVEIQDELAQREYSRSAEELAFTQAAEGDLDSEYSMLEHMRRYGKFKNRR